MKAIIKKLLKDFRLQKGKFILCVLAATISAWGISAVIYSSLMSDRDFKENYSKSNPVDFILTLKNPTDTLINKLKANADIKGLERREVLMGQIKNSGGNRMSCMLFAAEDLQHKNISKFDILEGHADSNSIFIEKNSKGFLKTEERQEIIFAGDTLQFNSAGFVHDPGMPPSQMEGTVYLYTDIKNFEKYLSKSDQRFLFSVKKEDPTGADLKEISDRVVKEVEQNRGTVSSINIPPPGEHPHQNIVDGISLLQKSFGGILSLLGITLLSLILLTWLYPQISDIGVMKTIGASTRKVFLGYLTILLMIIIVGLAIGLPLGYQTAKFYNKFIAMFQNFEVVKRPLPLLSNLLVIIPAIIIPLLFCIIPLLKTTGTSIQSALNKIFYTPHKGIFKITQRLIKSTGKKYGVNNLFRSNQRTSLLILLLMVGIGLLLSSANIKYSINKDFDNYFKTSNYDIIITLKDSVQGNLSYIEKLPFVEEVSYVKRKSVVFQAAGKVYKENKVLVILSPSYNINKELMLKGELKKNCPDCIYISQRFEPDFKNVALGSKIELEIKKEKKTFIYSGIIKELTAGPQFYTFSSQPNTWYRELDIKIKEGFSVTDAGRILDDTFLNNGIDVNQLINKKDGAKMLQNHLKPTYTIITAIGIFTIIVGLFGMLIVLNLSIKERLREMGIMKALGGSTKTISNLYGIEYLIINSIAAAGGILFGFALTKLLCTSFGDTMLNVAFSSSTDWSYLVIAIAVLLAVQTLLIAVYSRRKIRKSSAVLLNNVF
jgi:putative ABC transport system permease protein